MAARKRAAVVDVEPVQPEQVGEASVTDSEQADRVIAAATPKASKPAEVVVPLITIIDETGRKRQCAEVDLPYFEERGFRRK